MAANSDYLRYFGLQESPFALTPDPAFFFLTESHQRAMEGLETFVSRGEGFAALVGDIGTGKTTLCRALLERLNRNVETALVINPFLDETELVSAIASDLGLEEEPSGAGGRKTIERLGEFLTETRLEGKRCVVILDEAHNLPTAALEQVRILGNLETNKEKLLQIILVGQEEMMDVLNGPRMRQLRQRIARWHRLEPLSLDDIDPYFRFRLQRAGMSRDLKITPEARRQVSRLTGGYPRVMNMLFDRALVRVAQRGAWTVEVEDVNAAGREIPRPDARPARSAVKAAFAAPKLKGGLAKTAAVAVALAALAVVFVAGMLIAGSGAAGAGDPRWTVGLGAFASRGKAIEALNNLPAEVGGKRIVAPAPGGRGRYLACVGDFKDRAEADQVRLTLKSYDIRADVRDIRGWRLPGDRTNE